MTPFAEGIWVDIGPARILGMRLTTTMTVLRLDDGSLLLHSPLTLTAERRAAVEALGPVAHLYAPSRYHDLRIGEWAAAFPSARLHAPSGLVKERIDLRIDRVIGSAPEPAFLSVIDELLIEGFRLEETVLIYRPTRTLVVADLVHNVGRPQDWWTKLYTRLMGFYDRVAPSRVIRWAAFYDRSAARRSIDELLTRPFDSLICGTRDTFDHRRARGYRESLHLAAGGKSLINLQTDIVNLPNKSLQPTRDGRFSSVSRSTSFDPAWLSWTLGRAGSPFQQGGI